jgi:hypothetical protein
MVLDFFYKKIISCYVAQADLKFMTFLSQSPE